MQITSYSVYAQGILRQGSVATVHSVYRNTINLWIGETVLSLQPAGIPLSPLSLATDLSADQFALLDVAPGDAANFRDEEIILAKWRFAKSGGQIWDSALTSIPALAPSGAKRCMCKLQEGIAALAYKGGFADIALPTAEGWRASPAACRAMEQLLSVRHFAAEKRWPEAARSAAGLVGLGEGLTPSGDDFLCGMNAGLLMRRQKGQAREFLACLQEEILNAAERTNQISASFLRSACAGHFSPAVLAVAEGCSHSKLIDAFSRIGHSSGLDTLNGILFSLML